MKNDGGMHRTLALTIAICLFAVAGSVASVQRAEPASAMFIALGEAREIPRLTSPDTGVAFDIDGDGDLEHVAWTEPNSNVALLAIDVNSDGRITSGKELIGSHTIAETTNGPNALLQMFKASGTAISGALQQGHTLYEQILLWVDANHNGVSEPGELRPAKDMYTGIGLGFTKEDRSDEYGNRTRFKGWAELRTGGPEQREATEPGDHQDRLRFYYEVVLVVR